MFQLVCLFLLLMLSGVASSADATHSCQDLSIFKVGAGIYDITGPAAEQRMMGYAMINQQTAGLYSRLWARAFVIESPCNSKRIVFVNADLGQLFQGIKTHVIKRLQKKFGDLYTEQNVLLTAIHQHSGPGGYSTYALYNLSTMGFSRKNFDTIVDGIVAAIERAHHNMNLAHISMAKGQLNGVGFNRSPQAYALNPASERARYASNVDTEMTLLRFDTLNGKPIGMINWFPVHGVSMNNKNHLINGDNKGYAEYLFEKDFDSDYGPTAFVAAFAQANAGDVSPNEYGHEGGQGWEGLQAIEKAGKPQYEMAKKLFNEAKLPIKGVIDYRHRFVEMNKVMIDPSFTQGPSHTTCPAALGVAMLAGTTDGEGVGKQGITCENVKSIFPEFLCQMTTTACQGAKPIVLETESMKPYSWTPQILPLQMFKLGNLWVAATPFELTTMSGRRIKGTIEAQLSPNKQHHIVLSTLANAYAQYLTTYEEYQLQRYEGASTLFGPWSLAALQQQYAQLTQALVSDQMIAAGPTPPDLLSHQIELPMGVLFDSVPIAVKFGQVYQDVKTHYAPGETVSVTFWGGHPKNNYRIQDTYLAVQYLDQGVWRLIRQDRDWDTEYHWVRSGLASSLITIFWRIPTNIPPGKYRIVHYGDSKSFWTNTITPYVGYSAVFRIG